MRAASCLLWLLLALGAAEATACGVCIEDRAAVVYDHAVVERALERKHQVAFFSIDGTPALSAELRRTFIGLAESAPGVDKGSARVSRDPVSLAVAFDPRKVPLARLRKDFERRFAAKNVSPRFLQVLGASAPVE